MEDGVEIVRADERVQRARTRLASVLPTDEIARRNGVRRLAREWLAIEAPWATGEAWAPVVARVNDLTCYRAENGVLLVLRIESAGIAHGWGRTKDEAHRAALDAARQIVEAAR